MSNLLNSFLYPNFASGIESVAAMSSQQARCDKHEFQPSGSHHRLQHRLRQTVHGNPGARDPGGRNTKNAEEIRTLAQKESLPIHVLELDVTDDASVERAVNAAFAKAGRIDVAINNAGYYLGGLAEAVTTEQAQRQMDTNFFGPVRVNRAVLPYMRRQRSGLLMHISSGAGRVVLPSAGFYCASKFALEALAESYSYELAAQGIESVIVEPGAYETAVFGNSVTAADLARTDTYGAAKEFPAKLNGALLSAAGNAQEVADAVLRILETPAGEKHLRYRISAASLGVDEINALSTQVQASLLQAFGIAADTKFLKGKAVGSLLHEQPSGEGIPGEKSA